MSGKNRDDDTGDESVSRNVENVEKKDRRSSAGMNGWDGFLYSDNDSDVENVSKSTIRRPPNRLVGTSMGRIPPPPPSRRRSDVKEIVDSDLEILSSPERKEKRELKSSSKTKSSSPSSVVGESDSLFSDSNDDAGEKMKSKSKNLNHRKRKRVILSSDSDDSDAADAGKRSADVKKRTRRSLDSLPNSPPSPKKQRNRESREVIVIDDENSSDDDFVTDTKSKSPTKSAPRTCRTLFSFTQLTKETRQAQEAEKERIKRLEQSQKKFNDVELSFEAVDSASDSRVQKIVLDFDDRSVMPCPVEIDAKLVPKLKPLQIGGIKFIYSCLFESVEQTFKEGVVGGGGILAHCMGLGKTFQTIAFLDTVMRHPKLGAKAKHVLIVVPKNVVLNWHHEFAKWLGNDCWKRIKVMELDTLKTPEERRHALSVWHRHDKPAVMIMGYAMYRILTETEEDWSKTKRKHPKKISDRVRNVQPDCRKYLQDPGPDLIICDEAHMLKNDAATVTSCMSHIKTRRRLCLTGTPMQNYLEEYYVMMSFVKPGLLGTLKEFRNLFVNPIKNGRTKDASQMQVREMRQRCHVLYDLLKNIVERKDHQELVRSIPPKQEYLVRVRMTELQCQLYEQLNVFLDEYYERTGLRKTPMIDYHLFSRICAHPHQLIVHWETYKKQKQLQKNKKPNAKPKKSSFFNFDSDEEADPASAAPAMPIPEDAEEVGEFVEHKETFPHDWFVSTNLVTSEHKCKVELSNKLMIVVDLLKNCETIGDKILVFTQSLESLALIKQMLIFLARTKQWFSNGHEAVNAAGNRWGWEEGTDFVVIDGSVASTRRAELQTKFNNVNNRRLRMMLISTKAGSLGVTLVAANRVIIFDHNWNPSHDTQALFRVYRYGQVKPTYIYRILAQGTIEEKIYKNQVTKESTALRVVDEAQIQRHYYTHDLEQYYEFDAGEPYDPDKPMSAPPKDRLLAEVILANRELITGYDQHDSLFANQEEEKLTEEEVQEAWQKFQQDKVTDRRVMATKKQLEQMIQNGEDEDPDEEMAMGDVPFRTAAQVYLHNTSPNIGQLPTSSIRAGATATPKILKKGSRRDRYQLPHSSHYIAPTMIPQAATPNVVAFRRPAAPSINTTPRPAHPAIRGHNRTAMVPTRTSWNPGSSGYDF